MNRLQNSNLPFINLSKENLFLLCDMLELDEIGVLIVAIKEYLYEGKEPNLNTKPLRSAWSQVLMLIDRKADSYFTRKEQMEKINKSKKDKKAELTQASTSSIKDVKPEEFEIPNCQIEQNTADLSPSNNEEVEQPQPTVDNTTEAIKTTIEETIPNEFMEGLTDNTEEVKLDNFSEAFNIWLDDGNQEKLIDMATNIVKYEYMGIEVAKTAYGLAKTRLEEMLESFDTQDEKDMLCRHFDELLMLKKNYYKEFIKVA